RAPRPFLLAWRPDENSRLLDARETPFQPRAGGAQNYRLSGKETPPQSWSSEGRHAGGPDGIRRRQDRRSREQKASRYGGRPGSTAPSAGHESRGGQWRSGGRRRPL